MLGLGTSVNRGGFVSAADPLLLDTYSGASAAYSLRKLSNSYSGPVLQARRSGDNVEVDVSFDQNGVISLDSRVTNVPEETSGADQGSTAAVNLGQFVADSGYTDADSLGSPRDATAMTWYDQSGNSNDAAATNAAKQPKIYDASSGLVLDDNNKPTLSFDTNDMELANEIFLRSNTPDAFLISIVAEGRESGTTNGEYFTGHTQAALNFFATEAGSGLDRFALRHTNEADTGNVNLRFAFSADVAASEMALLNIYVESSTKKMQFNGQQLTGTGNSSWSNTNGYKLNIRTIGRGYSSDLNLKYSELIIWANQGSTDLSNIQSNINTFYSIF